MTVPMRPGDDPLDALKAMKAQRDSDPLAQLKAMKSPGATGDTDLHAEYASGRLAKRMARENASDREMAEAEAPSYGQQVAGGIASLARDIPGAEALQAGARALTRGQSYDEARSDIRGAEESAPAVVRNANRVIGGTVAAAASPIKSPALSGAAYGAASGAAQSDRSKGVGDRAKDAGIGAVVGAVTSKLADAGTNALRSVFAKSLDAQAAEQAALKSIVDRRNYGNATVEAWANGGTSPAVKAALDDPDVKPFVDVVRSSRTASGLDDAGLLREAYKLMGERQNNLGSRILNSDDFKAGSQLEQRDLASAKAMLGRAGGTVMPSFPVANEEHAAVSALEDARTAGSKMAKLAQATKQAADKNLLKKGESASASAIDSMTPMEAESALHGLFGRTKDYLHVTPNPVKGFGVPSALAKAGRLTPWVQALEEQLGGAPLPVDLLRALAASQGHSSP